jgi:hypothetical protein
MTQKKDAVGNNPLSHLIPRGPAPRPQITTAPQEAPPPVPVAPTPVAAPAITVTPVAASATLSAPASPPISAPRPPAAAPSPRPTAPVIASAAHAQDLPAPDASSEVQPLKRCTVRLPVALLERMTSAIVHTPGMTQADFVHDAIMAHLDDLERQRGAAFPVYGKKLRPGRKSW